MADETPPTSPTGKAMFNLPPLAVWALTTIAATSAGCLGLMTLSEKEQKVAMLVGIVSAAALGLTPGLRKVVPVALLVLSLGLTGCTSTKGFLITGQALDEVGAQFEVAAPIFYKNCEAKVLPVDVCRGWRGFAHRFQALYRPSANAWHTAALLNDAALAKRYGDMVGPLLAEFAAFYAGLVQAGLVKP